VSWIGLRDPWAGIAKVSIDGTLRATVDTYAADEEPHTVVFTASGLSAGAHTLQIQVTGTHSANSAESWIWVDAFDVTSGGAATATPTATSAPTATATPRATVTSTPTPASTPTPRVTAAPTRYEETAATFTGTWFTNNASANSGGQAVLAIDAGSRATFTFNGTGVAWIGYSDEWSGIARVFVDGTLRATVDTYGSPARAQKQLYAISGLAAGAHTLAVEATGTAGPSSGSAWIWVDAFDVTP
jgi:hypothetical protein